MVAGKANEAVEHGKRKLICLHLQHQPRHIATTYFLCGIALINLDKHMAHVTAEWYLAVSSMAGRRVTPMPKPVNGLLTPTMTLHVADACSR